MYTVRVMNSRVPGQCAHVLQTRFTYWYVL